MPEYVDLAECRLREPHQYAQRRGLAGTVRPEQSEHLAAAYLEIERRDRDEAAVLLAEAAYHERHVRILRVHRTESAAGPATRDRHDCDHADRDRGNDDAERPPPRRI